MMTGLHSQSEWFCKKKKNEFVIEQLSSHMQRERGWGANTHTHTHPLKSQSQSHTHSPLLCPALRLVQSHMLSAWMNTFLSTCPPSPLFLCFALPPSSPYLEWTFFFLSPPSCFYISLFPASYTKSLLLCWRCGHVCRCIYMFTASFAGERLWNREQETGSGRPHRAAEHFNLAPLIFPWHRA